ncbi:iron-sulfur cluster assembly scaffold protein [Mycobacterium lacus]|uniref:Similarity with Nitrogen-fixing NifU-like proteins n=1 Tax=Mycobacterium lacus TaxID=169765 RepID=A0A1X1YAA5_9MYCO|nr:iron-sulfur cluster assembly scaffold protein [Mycobacterium lacus]MCV7122500.1 iron-sulfur cluster assembly scaffold protein [Mycobacterium lacus]ORW07999.1 iron-sulfur cluster assembly scaffold protein [Mycobacterium lacus]BBX96593.1 similarity with Nitrogen-fixing NifU-like proteins [Mycobacterium lacus]
MPRFSATAIDHFTNPRNCGRLSSADASAFVGNPVCGDRILLTARVQDDVVSEVRFEAYGCSAALAIASILTERLRDMRIDDVAGLEVAQLRQWSGGLRPEQQHVATLGADAAHRLADNYRKGIHDDADTIATC